MVSAGENVSAKQEDLKSRPERYDPRSTDELIQLALTEDDDDAWDELVWILRYRGTQEVFDRASQLCESEVAKERELGVAILAQLGAGDDLFHEGTISILLELLNGETETEVLSAIGFAFGHRHDSSGVEPLSKLKNHPHEDVRFGVVHGLLWQADALAIETKIELSADSDKDVRNWATFGLGQLLDDEADGVDVPVDTPSIREALFARLTDSDEEVRDEAMAGLAKRGDHRVVPIVFKELSSGCIGEYDIEAARDLADPQFHPLLLEIKPWWVKSESDANLVEEALEACRPKNEENPSS